jgi:hypothetical protein
MGSAHRPTTLQLRLDLVPPAVAPTVADPEAMVRTLADLMLEALRPAADATAEVEGGHEHQADI